VDPVGSAGKEEEEDVVVGRVVDIIGVEVVALIVSCNITNSQSLSVIASFEDVRYNADEGTEETADHVASHVPAPVGNADT
jgi:hypothetical protein